MVEMTETATILNNATARSLVILDEIGRGTSTLDGLSLAWAITEHLAGAGCRTLFATHYHELTDLESRQAGGVRNLHVQVREWPGKDGHAQIVFLHRIVPGRADRSYGVQVARLAGLPAAVTDRAREVLESLSVQHGPGRAPSPQAAPNGRRAGAPPENQLPLFASEPAPHPALDEIRATARRDDPLQAFDALRRLRESLDHDRRPES